MTTTIKATASTTETAAEAEARERRRLRAKERDPEERPSADYLSGTQAGEMTKADRAYLIDAMHDFSRYHFLPRGTTLRATSYVDRYLSARKIDGGDGSQALVLAAAAVFAAAKYENYRSTLKKIDADDAADFAGCSRRELLDAEHELVAALGYRLGGPTAHTFVEHFTKHDQENEEERDDDDDNDYDEEESEESDYDEEESEESDEEEEEEESKESNDDDDDDDESEESDDDGEESNDDEDDDEEKEKKESKAVAINWLAHHLADMALLDYRCVALLPSTVAVGAIFLARLVLDCSTAPCFLETVAGWWWPEDLRECLDAIYDMHEYMLAWPGCMRLMEDWDASRCSYSLPSRSTLTKLL